MILRNVPAVPGETVIREYRFMMMDYRPKASVLRKRDLGEYDKIKRTAKARATLTVTNKRLMYNSENVHNSKKNSQFFQMGIGDVGDIRIMDAKWKAILAPLVIMILCLIFGFAFALLWIIAVIALIMVIIRVIRPKNVIYVSIGSKSAGDGFMVGSVSRSDINSIYFACKPGPDFNQMSAELGSLILDLQLNGDECLDRWVVDEPVPAVEEEN